MSANCRKATYLLTSLVLLAAGRSSLAQEVTAQPDSDMVALDDKIKQFLEGVSAGQAADAYGELLASSHLKKKEKETALNGLITKTVELEEKYGEYRGFEKVAAKRIGRDLMLFRYLYKCESFPVVWYFTFYRTPSPGETPPENGTWRVIAVRFDTRLELLWF